MNKTALLIVDVQEGLINEKPFKIEGTLKYIKELLTTFRENSMEIIYIQHDGKEGDILEPHSLGWNISNVILPIKEEKIIRKSYNSAFKNTELEEYLNRKGIETLVLVGMQTEYCIDTTCRVAFEKGFKVIIPDKTNTTFHNGFLSASEVYEYHNYNIFKDRFAELISVDEVKERISKDVL